MKRNMLMLVTGLALVGTAHAASFDCAKARTRVEKMICDTPEISKLDDAMSASYQVALQNHADAAAVKLAQKQWLKERNKCADVACVKAAYSVHLSPLASAVNSNQKICTAVSDTLLRISKLPPQSYEDPFYVDSIEIGGRTYGYQNVDLDGDGKSDRVEQSCGSPSDGTCTLSVALSGGGGYEVDEEIFHVMRFESKYYVLVGHPSSMKDHTRRMYALSAKGAELICKSF